jgi:hypothetical protein
MCHLQDKYSGSWGTVRMYFYISISVFGFMALNDSTLRGWKDRVTGISFKREKTHKIGEVSTE